MRVDTSASALSGSSRIARKACRCAEASACALSDAQPWPTWNTCQCAAQAAAIASLRIHFYRLVISSPASWNWSSCMLYIRESRVIANRSHRSACGAGVGPR